MERDTTLYDWEQHYSARELAEYMHSGRGRGVGRAYRTHGDLWNAPETLVQTGLLHLILAELRKSKADDDWLEKHREWLRFYRLDVVHLLTEREKHINRVKKLMGVKLPSVSDLRDNWWDLGFFSRTFRRDGWKKHGECMKEVKGQVERLISVKKPEDIGKLQGIGKKTVDKLLRQREQAKDIK